MEKVCTCSSTQYASILASLSITEFITSLAVEKASARVASCQFEYSSKQQALLAWRFRQYVSELIGCIVCNLQRNKGNSQRNKATVHTCSTASAATSGVTSFFAVSSQPL